MALVLLAAQSRFEALCSLIHQTAVHFCFGPLVINKLLMLFFLLVGLKIRRALFQGDFSMARVAAAPEMPRNSSS